MSALLPTLPGVSRIRLRPAPTRSLRRPSREVSHLPRFSAPHGAQAPRGAQGFFDAPSADACRRTDFCAEPGTPLVHKSGRKPALRLHSIDPPRGLASAAYARSPAKDGRRPDRGMSIARRYVRSRIGRSYQGNSFHCPSETTSTVPSVTLIAVWSSMAYAGPAMPAAHRCASAMVFSGMSS